MTHKNKAVELCDDILELIYQYYRSTKPLIPTVEAKIRQLRSLLQDEGKERNE